MFSPDKGCPLFQDIFESLTQPKVLTLPDLDLAVGSRIPLSAEGSQGKYGLHVKDYAGVDTVSFE